MAGYLKTGEFAALCGTTKDTLIHYDRTGLLRPVRVSGSGYRMYLPSQAYCFHSIRALAKAGLALDEVRLAICEEDALPDALRRSRTKLESRMVELAAALERIDELDRQVEAAGEARSRSPYIVHRPRRRLALFGVAATGAESYEGEAAVSRFMEVASELSASGPLGELALYGGECSAVPPADGPVRYDDLFCVLPDGAAYAGGTGAIDAGDYVVVYGECAPDATAEAHLELLEFARGRGLRCDMTRYEIACARAFDSSEGAYRFTVEMRAIPVDDR